MKRTITNVGCLLLLLTAPFCFAQSPQVRWARKVGDSAGGVATDVFGNTYVASDNTLGKYDPSGQVIWTATAASDGIFMPSINNVSVDQLGNAYISGDFWGSVTFGTNVITSAFGSTGEGFLVKVDSNGRFLWVKSLVSDGGAYIGRMAIGNNGVCYAVAEIFQHILVNGTEQYIGIGLIAEFSATGNLLGLIQTSEFENDIAVDYAGNIFLIGDSYLERLDFWNFWTIQNVDHWLGCAISLGSDGSVYTAGVSRGSYTNGFVCKYSASGDLIWSRFQTNAGPGAIALDSSDSVYVLGGYTGTNSFWKSAPASFDGIVLDGSDHTRSFVSKYDSSGNLQWVKGFGGEGDVIAQGIAVSGQDVFLSGSFRSSAIFGNFTLTATNSFYQAGFLVNLGVPEGPRLTLQVQRGQSPALMIGGVTGSTYQVEVADSLQSGWHPWVKFVLPYSPYTLFDPSPGPSSRFYRASQIQP